MNNNYSNYDNNQFRGTQPPWNGNHRSNNTDKNPRSYHARDNNTRHNLAYYNVVPPVLTPPLPDRVKHGARLPEDSNNSRHKHHHGEYISQAAISSNYVNSIPYQDIPVHNHDMEPTGGTINDGNIHNGQRHHDTRVYQNDRNTRVRRSENPPFNVPAPISQKYRPHLPIHGHEPHYDQQSNSFHQIQYPATQQRPHSSESISFNSNQLFDNDVPRGHQDSPWGDRELWELGNMKRHHSLPSMAKPPRQFDANLLLPYNSYRGNWPADSSHRGQQEEIMCLRYLANPWNAETFINGFVESCICEGLVLGVAADVLIDSRELQDLTDRTSKPVILAARDVLHEFVNEEVQCIALEERRQAVKRFWERIAEKSEVVDPVKEVIVSETIQDILRLVAAEAVGEMVNKYFKEKTIASLYSSMCEEVTDPLIHGVVTESFLDLSLDAVVDSLIAEEINVCASSFVEDVYPRGRPRFPMSEREKELEMAEICQKAEDFIPDAVILDELLRNMKYRNQVLTDAEYKEKSLDGILLDQLLLEHLQIQNSTESTLNKFPLQNVFDETTSDMLALDKRLLDEQNEREYEPESLTKSTMATPDYLT